MIAPRIGGAALTDGKLVPAKQKVDGGPSVLYDPVAVLASPDGAALLAKDAAARDFVTDAFAHCKFISYADAATALLAKARLADDLDEVCPDRQARRCARLRGEMRRPAVLAARSHANGSAQTGVCTTSANLCAGAASPRPSFISTKNGRCGPHVAAADAARAAISFCTGVPRGIGLVCSAFTRRGARDSLRTCRSRGGRKDLRLRAPRACAVGKNKLRGQTFRSPVKPRGSAKVPAERP